MNDAQEKYLRELCERSGCEFKEALSPEPASDEITARLRELLTFSSWAEVLAALARLAGDTAERHATMPYLCGSFDALCTRLLMLAAVARAKRI